MLKDVIKKYTRFDGCVVEFRKSNGDLRTMKCSTNFKKLAESNENFIEPKGLRDEKIDVLSVWDLEKDAWRRFKLDSVQKITIKGKMVYER